MNTFEYGNIADPKVYADGFVQDNFRATRARELYVRLAQQLLQEGDTTRALKVLDTGIEKIPFTQIRHDILSTLMMAETYYMAGAFDKGNAIAEDYARILEEYIDYYFRFTDRQAELVRPQLGSAIRSLKEIGNVASGYGQKELAEKIDQYFRSLGLM